MNTLPIMTPLQHTTNDAARSAQAPKAQPPSVLVSSRTDSPELREAFDEFIGTTFYSQMMKAMRETVEKPAYFHGGRAEEVFQSEMDQVVVKDLAKSSGSQLSGPMFELFQLQRHSG